MNEEEKNKTIQMIETLGYYGSYEAIREWFDWDADTIKKNMKECLDISNKRCKNEN